MLWPLSTYVSMFWTQHFPPPAPLTERNLPDQTGKVFIVTGGSSGLGAELVRILYQAGGTVYIMTRNEAKSRRVMADIVAAPAATPGTLRFIPLDLGDLRTVMPAADAFLAQESRLDVLWNNAGMGGQPAAMRTVQDIEIHHGVNNAGPFLLTQLLHSTLARTARVTPTGSVRVIWTGSIIVDLGSPVGGMDVADLDVWALSRASLYASSRVGNYFLASEFDRRSHDRGIVHLVQNPGTLKTAAWRYASFYQYGLLWPFFGDAIDGAHTCLWAGLDPGIKIADGGRYAMPWGRWHPGQRPDIVNGLISKDDGGSGAAETFYEWCEGKVAPFVA